MALNGMILDETTKGMSVDIKEKRYKDRALRAF